MKLPYIQKTNVETWLKLVHSRNKLLANFVFLGFSNDNIIDGQWYTRIKVLTNFPLTK